MLLVGGPPCRVRFSWTIARANRRPSIRNRCPPRSRAVDGTQAHAGRPASVSEVPWSNGIHSIQRAQILTDHIFIHHFQIPATYLRCCGLRLKWQLDVTQRLSEHWSILLDVDLLYIINTPLRIALRQVSVIMNSWPESPPRSHNSSRHDIEYGLAVTN